LHSKGVPPSLKAKVIYLLVQGLINTGNHNLAWKVCERAIKNVSPETDLEDWLRLQCILCHQDIFFNRNDSAGARLMGLEKIVAAQHSKHFKPLILELKGEYYQSLEDYSKARSNFKDSQEQFEMLRQFSRVQELIQKIEQIQHK
jgi:hypothetical protein